MNNAPGVGMSTRALSCSAAPIEGYIGCFRDSKTARIFDTLEVTSATEMNAEVKRAPGERNRSYSSSWFCSVDAQHHPPAHPLAFTKERGRDADEG